MSLNNSSSTSGLPDKLLFATFTYNSDGHKVWENVNPFSNNQSGPTDAIYDDSLDKIMAIHSYLLTNPTVPEYIRDKALDLINFDEEVLEFAKEIGLTWPLPEHFPAQEEISDDDETADPAPIVASGLNTDTESPIYTTTDLKTYHEILEEAPDWLPYIKDAITPFYSPDGDSFLQLDQTKIHPAYYHFVNQLKVPSEKVSLITKLFATEADPYPLGYCWLNMFDKAQHDTLRKLFPPGIPMTQLHTMTRLSSYVGTARLMDLGTHAHIIPAEPRKTELERDLLEGRLIEQFIMRMPKEDLKNELMRWVGLAGDPCSYRTEMRKFTQFYRNHCWLRARPTKFSTATLLQFFRPH